MTYITDKEQCQDKINKLSTVCPQCGGELTPIETVDNSDRPTFWPGCLPCSRYDHSGVDPLIHRIAKHLVTERYFRAYHYELEPDKNDKDKHDNYIKTQIGGMALQVREIIHVYNTLKKP